MRYILNETVDQLVTKGIDIYLRAVGSEGMATALELTSVLKSKNASGEVRLSETNLAQISAVIDTSLKTSGVQSLLGAYELFIFFQNPLPDEVPAEPVTLEVTQAPEEAQEEQEAPSNSLNVASEG